MHTGLRPSPAGGEDRPGLSKEVVVAEREVAMPDLALHHRAHPAVGGSGSHPGLVLLHGRGADESDLLPIASELDPRLFTVSARAPLQFPYGGYMWYEMDSDRVGFPETHTLHASLDLLRRFLAQITQAYPIDPRRLYVGGFSMGAVMAATLGLLEPDVVQGAIVLSGYLPIYSNLPFRLEESTGHPFFVAHGTRDDVIPIESCRLGRDYLAQTAVDLTYREYPAGHEISYMELQDLSQWLTGVLERQSVAYGD